MLAPKPEPAPLPLRDFFAEADFEDAFSYTASAGLDCAFQV